MVHELCFVDLQAKPENFTSLYGRALPSERAKVPLLEILDNDSQLPIPESMVVLEFLEDLVCSKEPLTPVERAACRLFAQMFSGWLNYVPVLRAEEGSTEEAEALESLLKGMVAADSFLSANGAEDGPFLLGERFSLAEMATAPFALRFLIVLPGLRPAVDPVSLMKQKELHRLSAWMSAVRERPSCTASLPPAGDLLESYKKLLARMAATLPNQ